MHCQDNQTQDQQVLVCGENNKAGSESQKQANLLWSNTNYWDHLPRSSQAQELRESAVPGGILELKVDRQMAPVGRDSRPSR